MTAQSNAEADLQAAQSELATYERAMELLRPFMEGTDRTLADVLEDPEARAILASLREYGWQTPGGRA